MKRANTMSTITVELTIKVRTKFTSSNAEKTSEKTNGFISRMSEIFTRCSQSPSKVNYRCTISAGYEVSQAQKAICFCHIQPKRQARQRKSLMHRYHHALMMSIIFHTMMTIGKRTSVLEFTANRNDGALRDVLVECLSPLPHSGSSPSQPSFGTVPIQQAPLERSTGNCPRV